MIKLIYILFFLLFISLPVNAAQIIGGDLTWKCLGSGEYVFQLIYYRDCNATDLNPSPVNLDVWNHPTINSIQLNLISKTDISPYCSVVQNGPKALKCGTGPFSGNGPGAIEKVIFKSDPIFLSGTPPAEGWIFTFQEAERSSLISNFVNPAGYGMTLAAKIFRTPKGNGKCVDSSPIFIQDPYFTSCTKSPYQFNSNAIDPDLDSIYVDFGIPYNSFAAGSKFDPPLNPIPVPFENGFNFSSPTPNTLFDASNIVSSINNSSGEINFTSFTPGNFNVKVVVKTYRYGVIMAEVEREMQLMINNCNGNNNPPIIKAPFANSKFDTTIVAGKPIHFTISTKDLDKLQDGSAQHNLISVSGPMFGNGFTSNSGCDIAPCATLNAAPVISGVSGSTVTFNWQTTCDHLKNQYGVVATSIPYNFVFKIQDDYCPIPKVSYATVTINVLNPGVIHGPEINCIKTDSSGNVTISWKKVANPYNKFIEYQIYTNQSGKIATINDVNNTTYIDPLTTSKNDYYVTAMSGCNGNTPRNSDTISSIFLKVTNPSNGTAVLDWNDPIKVKLPNMSSYYYVLREYPKGNWIIRDSVKYGTTNFIDTIDVCSAKINYKIQLKNKSCDYISNIDGDNFKDMITPDIPKLTHVTIDTLNNAVSINWDINKQNDTYGYIVYYLEDGGSITELDTVWGKNNTSYIYYPNVANNTLTYSVAAFDSCRLAANPTNFQTSAKANPHTTMFLYTNLDYCNNKITFNWTKYKGWQTIAGYEIWGKLKNKPWVTMGSATDTTLTISVQPYAEYCFLVKAFTFDGRYSLSNQKCVRIAPPARPKFNYIKTGTVNGLAIEINEYIDFPSNAEQIALFKFYENAFVEIDRKPVTTKNIQFIDENVQVDRYTYQYKTQVIDSCGNVGMFSNIVNPMLLKIQTDETNVVNYLNWTPYSQYNGSLLTYNIYRGVDGVLDPLPIASVNSGQTYYVDRVMNNYTLQKTGQLCYCIEAAESANVYGFYGRARSNISCPIVSPYIYVPNSFTPDGNEHNQEFLPIINYYDYTRYTLTIYDRWEHTVFESTDPSEGWHGQILNSGRPASNGTYIYKLSLYDGNGKEVVNRGYVNLVR